MNRGAEETQDLSVSKRSNFPFLKFNRISNIKTMFLWSWSSKWIKLPSNFLTFHQIFIPYHSPQSRQNGNLKTWIITPTLSFPCSISTHFSSALLTPNCHSIFIFSLDIRNFFLVKREKNVGNPPPRLLRITSFTNGQNVSTLWVKGLPF